MSLPRTGEYLDEVIYAEMDEDASKSMIEKYNSQGRDAGYGQSNQNPIKSRNESRNRWQNKREFLFFFFLILSFCVSYAKITIN